MANLALGQPRSSNNNLAFGASSGGQNTVISGTISLSPPTASGALRGVTQVSGTVAMPALIPLGSMSYRSNTLRPVQTSPRAPHQDGDALQRIMLSLMREPLDIESTACAPWQPAAILDTLTAAPWAERDNQQRSTRAVWQQASQRNAAMTAPWYARDNQQRTTRAPWQQGAAVAQINTHGWHYKPNRQAVKRLRWQADPAPRQRITHTPWQGSPPLVIIGRAIPWQQARVVLALWPRPDRFTPPPPLPRIISADLDLICPQDGTHGLHFGRVCGGGSSGQIIIPILRTYIVIHDISVLRLPDNYPIHASRVALSFDADAWAWSFSATLLGREALDAVMPSPSGEPVTLSININGHTWHVLVEDWTENREFGKRGVSVKGRGLSAHLAAPYVLPTSGTTSQARTMQQLILDHLPLGSGTGITWANNLADWLVPAGAWSWQNLSPIKAIHSAAQEVGMVVVPSMAGRGLTLQARYPILPWDFASATPNIIIPDAAILQLQRGQATNTQANAIYVHGSEVGGLLAHVKRQYNAGDRLAETHTSSLITHPDAARLAGSRLLAAQHQQPTLRSATLPLGGVFALGHIGQLLRVEVDGNPHAGIINAVAIDAARTTTNATVRQTLSIGEDTPNQWTQFNRLLPHSPVLLGTITSVYNNNTAAVTLLNGGTIRARGTGTTGQNVYVRDGVITAQAPQLPQAAIEA